MLIAYWSLRQAPVAASLHLELRLSSHTQEGRGSLRARDNVAGLLAGNDAEIADSLQGSLYPANARATRPEFCPRGEARAGRRAPGRGQATFKLPCGSYGRGFRPGSRPCPTRRGPLLGRGPAMREPSVMGGLGSRDSLTRRPAPAPASALAGAPLPRSLLRLAY